MARNNNEAKIKFTADTKGFTSAIQDADRNMSSLRAELKMHETQMKATGTSVEGLETKHQLLNRQWEESQRKVEALQGKVEAATRLFGANSAEAQNWSTKLVEAQARAERLRQSVQKSAEELDAYKAAQAKAESATNKLTGTIEKQQAEVDELKEEYVEAVLQYGKNSKEARDLAKKLKSLSGELKDNKDDLKDASDAADKLDRSLDDVGDGARGAEGGFTIMKGAIADLVSEGIQFAIGKISELIGYLAELPEATRELRQDMATLDTSFEQAGFTAEQAKSTWKDLYGIFGEDDRAVEAANLISKMSKNQEDLNSWVTITKGVWGSYQDSLPVEGLAEASNETAKTGQVTGVLADALNWSGEAASMFSKYMSEDVTTAEDAFNEALKDCSNEQERQQLIVDTLTKLYGDAAKTYEEASGAQIEEKNAAAEATLAQNELAEAVAPATTAWTNLKTEIITGFTPAIETVCGHLATAFEWLQAHPAAMTAVAAAVSALGAALTVLAVAMAIATVKQWLMNAAVLANPITWIVVGIVAAVAALIAIGVALYQNWDSVKQGFVNAWNAIKNAWNSCVEFFKGIWDGICNIFSSVGSWFSEKFNAAKEGVKNAWSSVTGWFGNVWNGIKTTFSNVGGWFKDKFAQAKNGAVNAWSNVKSGFANAWSNIKSAFSNVGGWFKDKFTQAKNNIMNVWSKIKLKLPNIKLPHFSISGKFSLNPLSVPKLKVDWYSKAMNAPTILKGATIFGHANGKFLGGGEAGNEMIGGTNTVMQMIQSAVDRSVQAMNIGVLADAIEDLANRPIEIGINGKAFALATASDTDAVNGVRAKLQNRGLILD